LRAAQNESTESVRQALSAFCEAYWPPLYTFLRQRRYSSTDAQDLVQAFFAHLLAQNTLSHADQAKGRLVRPECHDASLSGNQIEKVAIQLKLDRIVRESH
jgi:hypothetical protein